MKYFSLLYTIIFIAVVNIIDVPKHSSNNEELELHISTESAEVKVDSFFHLHLNATLKNKGNKTIKLIKPLDGSQHGWRMPFIKWSIKKINAQENDSIESDFQFRRGARCGNMNGIKESDFIELLPTQIIELPGINYPPIPREVGRYSVQVQYINNPRFKTENLRFTSSKIKRKIKKTRYAELVSNRIVIEIVE